MRQIDGLIEVEFEVMAFWVGAIWRCQPPPRVAFVSSSGPQAGPEW